MRVPSGVGLAFGSPHRPAVVEPEVPVLLHERLAEQELAGHAIEHVDEPVAIRPQHHLARPPLPVDVGEHRHLHRVPVELVVRA